ncbi:hypothetical protein GCM10023321_70270 [Pseudonocardia eucalypti]|uniref:Uncharacterized protein n=1 Tax=Pseudonocardia eucalypti TaxID=648755 RepID=A0ABP9R4A3_9PSEU
MSPTASPEVAPDCEALHSAESHPSVARIREIAVGREFVRSTVELESLSQLAVLPPTVQPLCASVRRMAALRPAPATIRATVAVPALPAQPVSWSQSTEPWVSTPVPSPVSTPRPEDEVQSPPRTAQRAVPACARSSAVVRTIRPLVLDTESPEQPFPLSAQSTRASATDGAPNRAATVRVTSQPTAPAWQRARLPAALRVVPTVRRPVA